MDNRIERIFEEAIENAWEEAKLQDLITLYSMWKSGKIPSYSTFEELFDCFIKFDKKIREMDEKKYLEIENLIVEMICSSPDDIPSNLCERKKSRERKNKP